MRKELPKFMRMEAYRGVGKALEHYEEALRYVGESTLKAAKYEMSMEPKELIEALDFIDFAKMYNHRVTTFNKMDNPGYLRTIKFRASDGEEKTLSFALDKRVGRIDFKSLAKAKIKLQDLLEIIYLNPEVNAIFLGLINEPKRYTFSKCRTTKNGKSTFSYYFNDIARSFECILFAETDPSGYVLNLGNKGRILIDRFFECGKYLEIPEYMQAKPLTKEDKAIYEVTLMDKYYRKVWGYIVYGLGVAVLLPLTFFMKVKYNEVMERIDDLQFENLKIIQDTDGFRFGIDSVLLTDFARDIKNNSAIADLGTGTGVLTILLSKKVNPKKIIGFEKQVEVANLAKRSVELNKLDNAEIRNIDIKDVFNEFDRNSFDIVVTNPPYKKQGTGINAANEKQQISRFETSVDLAEWIKIASNLINSKGSFYMVYRTDRLGELIEELNKNKLAVKRLRFVHSKLSEQSNLVLLKATKNGGTFVTVEKPLIIYNEDGSYTEEIMTMYNKGKESS